DGALRIDLRRFRNGRLTSIPDVQVQALLKCGWNSDEIPSGDAARRAAYERQFADKRMLLVLDHVQHEAEVLELDPRAQQCTVVATSHRRDEFVDNQRFLSLDPLEDRRSREVLEALIGQRRVAA